MGAHAPSGTFWGRHFDILVHTNMINPGIPITRNETDQILLRWVFNFESNVNSSFEGFGL